MSNINAARPGGIYSKLFSAIYDPFMSRFEARILLKRRRKLLTTLQGNILEVGAGTGINFPLYPAGTKVLAIEPSADMLKKAGEKTPGESYAADIRLLLAGIGDKALEQEVPKAGFDAIVFTLVLCTIPDPEAALRQSVAWLKPGGKIIVLEHIASSDKWGYRVQQAINPFWKHLAEGCNLHRHTDKLLKDMGFNVEHEEYFTKMLPFYVATFIK
jgi:SAM-dependent methyltransferase